MKLRIASLAVLLGCLGAQAGEIVIIESADKNARTSREPSRSERQLGKSMDKAREYAGTADAPAVVDDSGSSRAAQNAGQSIRDAQDYLRPGTGAAAPADGTTIILRSAPSETDKLRQKARSYAAPGSGAKTSSPCDVGNAVGTIGNERTTTVIETGNSAVIVNCK